ncbi:aldo/keto reductase [Pseudonocardia acidicola]|nr:aldo/keto reductase [Pseudonocardia acidicola]
MGTSVSRVCIGTATFGVAPLAEDVGKLVHQALDAGVNFIDTANSYGNQGRFDRPGVPPANQRASAEELVGAALKGRRDEVVLATKVSEPVGAGPNDGGLFGGGLSRVHIMRQVERSLRRLGTDHIDVYYAHHPDPLTRIEETLQTFEDLIRQGKIRHYALSTYGGWQLTEAVLRADQLGLRRPVCHQTRYNVADRWVETDVLPASRHLGISTTVFSPLAGGLLAGVGRQREFAGDTRWGGRGFSEQQLQLAERFTNLAESWGHRPAHVALAWLLAQPGIGSVIIGPESVEELESAMPAADLELDEAQVAQLTALVPSPPGFWG